MIAPGALDVIPGRLNELLSIETQLGFELSILGVAAEGDPEATALLHSIAFLAETHANRLRDRIEALGLASPAQATGIRIPSEAMGPEQALRRVFVLLSEAVIGYAALSPVCNRFRDSPITAHEGMTSHLARDHSQDYLSAMGRLGGAIQGVIIRELVSQGYECQCTCPACGLGLCVCGLGARAGFSEAWVAARPVSGDADLAIPKPRATSAAAVAGFQDGDQLINCDGALIASYPQLQTTIKGHEMGEEIRFTIRRDGSEKTVGVQRNADLGTSELPLDCEAPSGQVFYMDRARDLQQTLRRRAANSAGPLDLATLSIRETQVLRLMTDGATNQMIAAKLHISRPTVARHVHNILTKLNVANRSEAAAMAAANGFARDA